MLLQSYFIQKNLIANSLKNMDLVNDLGAEIAFAVLVEKKYSNKMQNQDVLSLISRLKEILEPVSTKDHIHEEITPGTISLN